jgi:hypothetical protein
MVIPGFGPLVELERYFNALCQFAQGCIDAPEAPPDFIEKRMAERDTAVLWTFGGTADPEVPKLSSAEARSKNA